MALTLSMFYLAAAFVTYLMLPLLLEVIVMKAKLTTVVGIKVTVVAKLIT